MEILVTKPEKKKDYFMGRLLTVDRKPIQVMLKDVQWMRTVETRDQNLLVRVYVPHHCESKNVLETLDAKVFQACCQNNDKWFHNALDEDKLRNFFRPSIDRGHPSMGILCNMWAEPTIYLDGQLVESMKSLHVSKDAHVKMLIEAQGVMFQKTIFGIRWVLRKCWIHTPETISADIIHPFEDERNTIEAYWEEEVEKYVDRMASQIQVLEGYIQNIKGMLHDAKTTREEKEWNDLLTNISKTIFQGEYALEKSHRENQNFI